MPVPAQGGDGGLALTAFLRPSWGMETDLTKAQHFRDQAAQMRELAAKEDNLEAKKALIHLAEMYDRLCRNRIGRADPGRF